MLQEWLICISALSPKITIYQKSWKIGNFLHLFVMVQGILFFAADWPRVLGRYGRWVILVKPTQTWPTQPTLINLYPQWIIERHSINCNLDGHVNFEYFYLQPSPTQGCRAKQNNFSELFPGQSAPENWGGGLLHCRVLKKSSIQKNVWIRRQLVEASWVLCIPVKTSMLTFVPKNSFGCELITRYLSMMEWNYWLSPSFPGTLMIFTLFC